MKIIAINASPRAKGNTADLIQTALEPMEKRGMETEIIHIGGQPIHSCRGCGRCEKKQNQACAMDDDIFNEIFGKMVRAQAILLGSPTYFADVTPEMKALMDRAGYVAMVNGGLLGRKVGAAVVAAYRAGSIHAFDTMNHLFSYSGMIIPGADNWNLGVGLNPGDVQNDPTGLQTMKTLGENMAWLLERIGQP
ncbi:MAG: flavodoxin family protein [Desulfobacterales bacterium]|nr:flavodoxin family protein [Desulfobacterales bacterium]